MDVANRCWVCVTNWVDRAWRAAGVRLTELERRRLIAALLARPHLILSGPAGIGKGRLARALSLSGVNDERGRVCFLQGHPWWAANTANVSHFVELQTDYSLWRLAHFAYSAVNGEESFSPDVMTEAAAGNGQGGEPADQICVHVACVERLSPVEIELYFRVFAEWLLRDGAGESWFLPLRLIGTFDSLAPPHLDERVRRITGLVHLSGSGQGAPGGHLPGADKAARAEA